MRGWLSSAVLLGFCVAGCAQVSPATPSSAGLAERVPLLAHAGNERILHRFQGGRDGYLGEPVLLNLNGTLYGTTQRGGGSSACTNGCGTLYSIASSGSGYTVLYRFQGGQDGAIPQAGLTAVGSALYAATGYGGGASGCVNKYESGCGTVVSIAPSGKNYRVVYRFKGGNDAALAEGNLANVNGVLYGLSFSGGASTCTYSALSGCGTLYAVDTATGKERVVYSLQGGNDGAHPVAEPTLLNGTLYGISWYGGGTGCGGGGCGSIFTWDLSKAKERVLYGFGSGSKGEYPETNLVPIDGQLYGNAANGGAHGMGTVFKTDPTTGKTSIVYSFTGGADGALPNGGLIAVGNELYGVTAYGGGGTCKAGSYVGCGTVFAVSTSGVERVVYAFRGGRDGFLPGNSVLYVDGELYGTTLLGGGTNCKAPAGSGCGTIFAVKP